MLRTGPRRDAPRPRDAPSARWSIPRRPSLGLWPQHHVSCPILSCREDRCRLVRPRISPHHILLHRADSRGASRLVSRGRRRRSREHATMLLAQQRPRLLNASWAEIPPHLCQSRARSWAGRRPTSLVNRGKPFPSSRNRCRGAPPRPPCLRQATGRRSSAVRSCAIQLSPSRPRAMTPRWPWRARRSVAESPITHGGSLIVRW